MIIARGEYDGDQLVMLGLSTENITRLVAGEPMLLKRVSHGDGIPDGWTILIIHGETEGDMEKMLRKAGVVDDMTNTIIDKRIKQP